MEDIFSFIDDNKILIRLKKHFYEKLAIFSAAHKFTDNFIIKIDEIDNQTVGIYLSLKDSRNKELLKSAPEEFCNEVLDQQIRLDIEKKYGPIRDIIVNQAFSPISIKDLKNEIKKKL